MSHERPFSDKEEKKKVPGQNERGVFEIPVNPEDKKKVQMGLKRALKSLEGKPER